MQFMKSPLPTASGKMFFMDDPLCPVTSRKSVNTVGFSRTILDRNPTSWMFGGEKVANYLTLPIMEVFTPAKLQAMNHAVYI